ncbi:MAG TPA: hypothetical protein VIK21_00745, partial [Desulfuromonadaceae bacterium]
CLTTAFMRLLPYPCECFPDGNASRLSVMGTLCAGGWQAETLAKVYAERGFLLHAFSLPASNYHHLRPTYISVSHQTADIKN